MMATDKINEGENITKTQSRKITWRWVKLLVIIALIVAGVLYFHTYLSHGNKPAVLEVPAEPFKHIWSEKKVLLLGIGDDITAGDIGHDGFSYFERMVQNPPGDSPDMTGKNLSKVFPNLKTTNIASTWSTSFNHLEGIKMMPINQQDVMGIVVITTGLNEILHSYGTESPQERAIYGATIEQAMPWLDNFQNRLDEMVMSTEHIFPGGCRIFIANIYDPTDGTSFTKNWFANAPQWLEGLAILEAYNQAIQECAKKYNKVHIVDIHKAFLGHGIHSAKTGHDKENQECWYQTKSADPSANELGHDVIRRLFLNEMVKVFYDANDNRTSK
jgi:hypothetical protein